LHGDVGSRFGQAFVDGADAMADFQADVPKQPHQLLQLDLQRSIGCRFQQNQHVDIRVRK
jgi:hypothetical protein